MGGERRVAQRSGDKGADAGPGRDQPCVLELLVRLQDRVRVDRQSLDDLFHRRQLVALLQKTEAEGVTDHLADESAWYGETPERVSRWNSITVTLDSSSRW